MPAKPRKSATFRAWAIRGGRSRDVDGTEREVGYLGRGFFGWDAPAQCLGMSIALFATRRAAREAMRKGPKHRTLGAGIGGSDFVAFPNASVERVKVTLEPA